MTQREWADKLKFVPIAHYYSFWCYTKRLNYLDAVCVCLAGAASAILWDSVFSILPKHVTELLTPLCLYTITLSTVLTAKKLQSRHEKSKGP